MLTVSGGGDPHTPALSGGPIDTNKTYMYLPTLTVRLLQQGQHEAIQTFIESHVLKFF